MASIWEGGGMGLPLADVAYSSRAMKGKWLNKEDVAKNRPKERLLVDWSCCGGRSVLFDLCNC